MMESAVLSHAQTSNGYPLSTAANRLGWLTKDLPSLDVRWSNHWSCDDFK